MPRGISLHVGLNSVDPAHYDGWNGALNACEFDVSLMQAIAESRGFEPTTLADRGGNRRRRHGGGRGRGPGAGRRRLLLLHVLGPRRAGSATRTERKRIAPTRRGFCTTASSSTTSSTRCGRSSIPACASSSSRTAATAGACPCHRCRRARHRRHQRVRRRAVAALSGDAARRDDGDLPQQQGPTTTSRPRPPSAES